MCTDPVAPEIDNVRMLRDLGRKLIDGEPMLAPASSEGDQVISQSSAEFPFSGFGYALITLPTLAMR